MLCARVLLSCFIQAYAPPSEVDISGVQGIEVRFLSADDIQIACWDAPDEWSWACVTPTYVPIIVIRDELKGYPKETAVLIAHEKAHIKGWRHTH